LEIDERGMKAWHHSITKVFSRAESLAVPVVPFVYLHQLFSFRII